MYRACFLSYALAVGTRVVERQRMDGAIQQPSDSNSPVSVKPKDFSSTTHYDSFVVRQKLVDKALDQMAPEQRALMELAYFEGLTESQLAARLDLPINSIRARMILALQHLDALLGESQPSTA